METLNIKELLQVRGGGDDNVGGEEPVKDAANV